MPWRQYLTDTSAWRDLIHFYSNWVAFCPILMVASSKNNGEREQSENRFLSKFLFSLVIQVTVGVAGAFGGSYITLHIVTYRMEKAEEAIKVIQARQFRNEDRITKNESDLAVITERHRIEERNGK